MSAARARSATVSFISSGDFITPFFWRTFLVLGLDEIASKSSAFFSGVFGIASTVFFSALFFAILFGKVGVEGLAVSSSELWRISCLRFSRNRLTLSLVCCRIFSLLSSFASFSSCFFFLLNCKLLLFLLLRPPCHANICLLRFAFVLFHVGNFALTISLVVLSVCFSFLLTFVLSTRKSGEV